MSSMPSKPTDLCVASLAIVWPAPLGLRLIGMTLGDGRRDDCAMEPQTLKAQGRPD
jgi:hypothetical protein